MKTCPKCQKTYDDSWKVCLSCREKLVSERSSLPAGPGAPAHEESAKRKAPKGVIIFAWLVIISSLLGLLFLQPTRQVNPRFSFFLYLAVFPLSIVVSIFLIMLKKWARIAIIIISVIVALETLVTVPYSMKKGKELFAGQFDAQFEQAFNERLDSMRQQEEQQGNVPIQIDEARIEAIRDKAKASAENFLRALMTILLILSLGFNMGVIYYFTRSPIKATFS